MRISLWKTLKSEQKASFNCDAVCDVATLALIKKAYFLDSVYQNMNLQSYTKAPICWLSGKTNTSEIGLLT